VVDRVYRDRITLTLQLTEHEILLRDIQG